MRLSIRHWRPAHLLVSWATYWAALAVVKLGPAVSILNRIHTPDAKGSVSLGFDEGVVRVGIFEGGLQVWQANASAGSVAAWVIGPPLVLWLLWMATRPSRSGAAAELGAGAAEPIPVPSERDREHVDRR